MKIGLWRCGAGCGCRLLPLLLPESLGVGEYVRFFHTAAAAAAAVRKQPRKERVSLGVEWTVEERRRSGDQFPSNGDVKITSILASVTNGEN